MSNGLYQSEKRIGGSGVARAAAVATEFVKEVKKGDDDAGSVRKAATAVAKQSGIGKAFILRLVQPSRRPKSIDWDVGTRLVEAYLKYLRRQHRELEIKIKLVEALAGSDRASVRDLLHEAEALQNRIKALL